MMKENDCRQKNSSKKSEIVIDFFYVKKVQPNTKYGAKTLGKNQTIEISEAGTQKN